jgi:hypothetical protein
MHASLLDATRGPCIAPERRQKVEPACPDILRDIDGARPAGGHACAIPICHGLLPALGLGEPAEAAPLPQMSVKERTALLSITEEALEKPELIGEDALAKNDALPFSDAPDPCGQAVCDPQLFLGRRANGICNA